jgi:hypothetical protein
MTYVETALRRGAEGMTTGSTRKAATFTVKSMS